MGFANGGQTKTMISYDEGDIVPTSEMLSLSEKGKCVELCFVCGAHSKQSRKDWLRRNFGLTKYGQEIKSLTGKWTTCGTKIVELNLVDGRPDGYQYLLLLVPQEAIFKKGTLLEGDAFWRLGSKEFFNGELSQYSDTFWSEFSQY